MEVQRLQGDNRLLSAKLKEALSVQPAAVDPRELARAEDRIRALQKENDHYVKQIGALKNDPTMIEREAREQLHYARRGEVIYVSPSVAATQPPVTNSAKN